MSEPIVAPMRTVYDELTRRLDAASPEGDREAIKREIIALFKAVDQGIAELTQLKEDIRTLVEKYKQLAQGESGEQVLKRMKSFIAEKLPDDEDIILVTHDGWIRLLISQILDIPVYRRWDFVVDTCGIMEIEYQPESIF